MPLEPRKHVAIGNMGMSIRPLLTFLILVVLAGRPGAAESISLSQSLDRPQVAYDETATLEIVLTWPGPQSAYRFDRPLQPVLQKLRVGKFSTTVSSVGAGGDEITTKRFHYELIPTEAGLGRVEPMRVEYVSWPDSIPGELVTEPVTVQIAAPIPEPPKSNDLPIWLLVLVAVCLIGGGVAAVITVRKRSQALRPDKTPSERLLERLAELQKEVGSDLKRFQTGLFPIIVEYLERRFELPLAGRSAEEIAEALNRTALTESQRLQVAEWLERAEREKYQPIQAAPGKTIRLANEVKLFFEKM